MSGKRIILCPNPSRDYGMKATRTAEKLLRELGFQTVVCSPFRDQRDGAFAGFDVRPLPQELRNADLMITFGGDGTILHLAMRDGRQVYTNLGLNDAVIREGPISHVIHLKIASDGRHLADIAGDGVILSTPTGSTAYSLSAGGPVVEPAAQILLVTPICIHNMRFSSYVLSPGHELEVTLERNGRKPVSLFVDESRAFALRSDDRVLVRRSKYVTRIVRLTEKSFCEIFAQKMLPGGLNDEK